jgi:hypothetical protein
VPQIARTEDLLTTNTRRGSVYSQSHEFGNWILLKENAVSLSGSFLLIVIPTTVPQFTDSPACDV